MGITRDNVEGTIKRVTTLKKGLSRSCTGSVKILHFDKGKLCCLVCKLEVCLDHVTPVSKSNNELGVFIKLRDDVRDDRFVFDGKQRLVDDARILPHPSSSASGEEYYILHWCSLSIRPLERLASS